MEDEMAYNLPIENSLRGPFAPMRFEATVDECIVTAGEIPRDLAGGYYRAGPTWKRPTKQGTNPVLGIDGMVQGLVFDNGDAFYKNRWVRTPKYVAEEQRRGTGIFEWEDAGWGDWRDNAWGDVRRTPENCGISQGRANVNTIPFQGELLAVGEQGGPPIALDPITLETKGVVPWSAQLSSGLHTPAGYGDATFTVHPKWDSDTGMLYGYAYSDEPPFVTMHFVHPNGMVESRELWDAPYNTVAHDVWLTPEWVVVPFQPFLADKKRFVKDLNVWEWNPDLPIIIALVPRHDLANGEVRYIKADLPPQYIMHTMSANVVGDELQLDGPIFNRPPFPFEQDFALGDDVALFFSVAASRLGRWTINLKTGASKSEQLSDRPSELPKVDERFYGKGYEWGCQVGGVVKGAGMKMNSLVMTNMRTMAEQVYEIRQDQPAAVLEASFAPRTKDAPEGDGYIIVPVSWWAEKRGEFQIFDTYDITKGPICRIELPFHMGWTPHGHWMDFR
jgi:carotenoid cleavage dioxygenase-like enzyme